MLHRQAQVRDGAALVPLHQDVLRFQISVRNCWLACSQREKVPSNSITTVWILTSRARRQTQFYSTFIESQNGLGWKRPLEAIQSNPSAASRDIFNSIRVLRAPSNLGLDVSRDGASPTSLDNLGHSLTNLTVKNVFLVSNLNVPSSSLKPSPLVPSRHVPAPLQLSRSPSRPWQLL